MSVIPPKRRRPDQNTGLRAKTAKHVEDAACTTGGLHELTNLGPVTLCSGCLLDWQTLDGELNGRLATRGEG